MQGGCTLVDYFKLFKVFQLKKIEKTGLVKIIQDKELNRKIISVEGNISTSNFIAFQTHNFPNVPFSERYLYLQGFVDTGKSFCFQVTYSLGAKQFKAVYSSLYKSPKKHLENIVHLPITLPPNKWTIAVVDLYELGLHFGFKAQEMKMIFRVNSVELRASSKVKGVFQSDHLFSIDKMPKDMALPLKKQQTFFDKYHYFVESTDPATLKYATQVKQVIEQSVKQSKQQAKQSKQQAKQSKHEAADRKDSLKQSKSVENRKQLAASKSRKSLEKDKNSDKTTTRQVKSSHAIKKPQSNPPLPRKKEEKPVQPKTIAKQEQLDDDEIEQQQVAPLPQAMIAVSLSCVEGFSLNSGALMAVQSYLYRPVYMAVHKPIQLLASCDDHHVKAVTGYHDGSICLWDLIRKTPLAYFLTELNEVKVIIADAKFNLVLIGLDKMKREVINIVSEGSIIFRQISNYNINGALLVSKLSFQFGIITYGFENIRLWRINNEKAIIQGSNVYLGQSNRKVKYTSAIVIQTREDFIAYVSDNNGFITTISVSEGTMLQSLKVDECCIDQMVLLRDGRCLITNQAGTIRTLNMERMEVLEEFSLGNRVKEMSQLPSEEIVVTHFNKSVGLLNLQSSMYSFLLRSHTALITRLAYNPHLNKVVSISKDSSIRIWQYVVEHDGPFPFRLQEQYQFVITGEEMVDLGCGVEGKADELRRVVVGGDSGKLRLINVELYAIEQEVMLETGPMSLSLSRNGKYVLCTYSSGASYLLDSSLSILYKYLRNDNHKKKMKAWRNGFNTVNKEYYLENIEEDRLQFYALKDPAAPIFTIRSKVDKNASISFIGSKVYLLAECELQLFEKGSLMQVLNLSSPLMRTTCIDRCTAFVFPLLCVAAGDKLLVRVVTAQLEQEQQLPEPLSSITIHYNSEKQQGLLVCAGKHSFALYVFAYQLHNISQAILPETAPEKYEDSEIPAQHNQLQISFSNKTTVSGYVKREERHSKISQLEEAPKELRTLYGQQEALYEEVKQYLFPKSFQQPPVQQCDDEEVQVREDAVEHELGVLLNYGYQLRQDAGEDEIGRFYWLSENNSLILLTGGSRSIMQHFFSVPIRHKIVSFPSPVTSTCISQRPSEGLRYLAVSVSGLVKLYNVFEQVSFIRSIDAISSTFLGAVIFQSCITNCNRYLLTLSYNSIAFDGKLYIHVLELSSGSVVSSSYLALPAPKNKHKGTQLSQARECRMLVNPFKSALEFVVFTPQGLLYFYRITSILTLQTMQLEELLPLCRDKTSTLSCGCFIAVGDPLLEDAVLALGSENGSIVFIDCRTANIMVACIALLPTAVRSIAYNRQGEDCDKLILFTNSPLLTIFSLTRGLNSLLAAMQQQSSSDKRTMTLDGEVTAHSSIESSGQQIVITKAGSLWLLDYEDGVTVKVSSVHSQSINWAKVLECQEEAVLLTLSDDGSAKISNFDNLEQAVEIYKPRKQAKAGSTDGPFTLISFNEEVHIYSKIDPQNILQHCQLTSLGSFRLDSPVIAIQNIPSSQNYYILTLNELLIVFVALPRGAAQARVEVQRISEAEGAAAIVVNAEHAPYDQVAVLGRAGRVAIWARKCLKRNYNPLEQLARVHQLTYYLIDAHSRTTTDASYLRFLSQSEYLWAVLEEGTVQVRNFRDHSITREVKLSGSSLSAMLCVGQHQLGFYAGDQHGYIYIFNENGLLVEKAKALECRVQGMQLWRSGRRLLVYGGKYAVTLATPSLHYA